MSDPQPSAPSRKPLVLGSIAFLVVVAVGTGWYILRGKGEQPAPATMAPPPVAPAPTAPPPQEAPPAQATPLPALEQSDPHVREMLGRLSTDAEFQKWLGIEGLIRRFTAAIA